MPNSINVQINVSQNNNGLSIIDNKIDAYTASGSLCIANIQTIVPGAWQALSQSLGQLSYLFLYNDSTASTIAVATNSASNAITDYIQPQGFCLKSWNNTQGAFYASSSLSASLLHVLPLAS